MYEKDPESPLQTANAAVHKHNNSLKTISQQLSSKTNSQLT